MTLPTETLEEGDEVCGDGPRAWVLGSKFLLKNLESSDRILESKRVARNS